MRGPISVNNLFRIFSSAMYLAAILLLCTVSILARVISFSAALRTSRAFDFVVVTRSYLKSEVTMFRDIARRWAVVRESGLKPILCFICFFLMFGQFKILEVAVVSHSKSQAALFKLSFNLFKALLTKVTCFGNIVFCLFC